MTVLPKRLAWLSKNEWFFAIKQVLYFICSAFIIINSCSCFNSVSSRIRENSAAIEAKYLRLYCS